MTLSAMTDDGRCFNPSVLIAGGKAEAAVVEQMRLLATKGLYCPHCFQRTGQRLKLGFRNPKERRKHFYHLESVDGARECRSYSNESERHLAAKAAIAQALSVAGGVVSLEHRLHSPTDGTRRPDVFCVGQDGVKTAHEIQISYINAAQLKQRTQALIALGVDCVVWYLYGKNYSRENREYCAGNPAVTRYRLEFDEEDVAVVSWHLDMQSKWSDRKSQQGRDQDSCGKVQTPQQMHALTPKQSAKTSQDGIPEAARRYIRNDAPIPGQLYGLGTEIRGDLGWHGWIVGWRVNGDSVLYYVWFWERTFPPHGTEKSDARLWQQAPVITKRQEDIVLWSNAA